ncbi:hypothetical protein [Streptomyces ipomoeae]|uniref:hypothetical protein n=1 Tax=Streptomyces ipomoeae TaxID=103232 RepID=UPI0011468B98|nr:hypothetical protein [Streptomyces ipomoeae]MDX2937043.1 hypothetical protein [Streptomyces ipomoeae]TQE18461.1 hypothetical protein SipoB123_34740 [Streptomyces ipomoeae]
MNRRTLLGAAAAGVPLAVAPGLVTPASASSQHYGGRYQLEKDNCIHFHIADFVAWNNRRWDMQAYYHASDVYVDVYVEMGGAATANVEDHIVAMKDILKDNPEARILQHYPRSCRGSGRRPSATTSPAVPPLHHRPPPPGSDGRGVPLQAGDVTAKYGHVADAAHASRRGGELPVRRVAQPVPLDCRFSFARVASTRAGSVSIPKI